MIHLNVPISITCGQYKWEGHYIRRPALLCDIYSSMFIIDFNYMCTYMYMYTCKLYVHIHVHVHMYMDVDVYMQVLYMILNVCCFYMYYILE